MSDPLLKYRSELVTLLQKSQEQFDKAILTLSGGALGVSFTFVENFVSEELILKPNLLIIAWSSWAISIAFALVSYYLSPIAIEKAIKQVDNRTIHDEHPGGHSDLIVRVCNFFSAILFLIGVYYVIQFVSLNYGK